MRVIAHRQLPRDSVMLIGLVGASLRSVPRRKGGSHRCKAHLPPRWFIKTFWHVHRRIVRASECRWGVGSAPG